VGKNVLAISEYLPMKKAYGCPQTWARANAPLKVQKLVTILFDIQTSYIAAGT